MLKHVGLFGLLLGATSATVLEARAKRSCSNHTLVNNKLAACTTASEFCSRFLDYSTGLAPTITSTLTLHGVNTTIKTFTTTCTETVTNYNKTAVTGTANVAGPGSTSTITSVADCTAIAVSPVTIASGVRKRALNETGPSCGVRGLPIKAVSTGCSCLLDPTVTATVTKYSKTVVKTTTVTTQYSTIVGTTSIGLNVTTTPIVLTTVTLTPPCPTATTSCDNAGLQWAYYYVAPKPTCVAGTTADVYRDNFEPAGFKATLPVQNDVTGEIGGFQTTDGDSPFVIYNHTLASRYFALDHKGYFYAPQQGAYKFSFDFVNDKAWIWLGRNAYAGWNSTNYGQYVTGGDYSLAPPFAAFLEADTYYPMRLFFAQGHGPGGLLYSITGPDGIVLAGSNYTPSPYLVQFACDDVSAPAYSAWGAEV